MRAIESHKNLPSIEGNRSDIYKAFVQKSVGHTAQNWSFPLRISSVNVINSAGNRGVGHIYWRNP